VARTEARVARTEGRVVRTEGRVARGEGRGSMEGSRLDQFVRSGKHGQRAAENSWPGSAASSW